jgi:hypothetical protein
VLDDLRWRGTRPEGGSGEGEARVECFGDVATVLDALESAGQEGAVLAVQRA